MLLASFLSFFVLITAVDAAACVAEEAGASLTAATAERFVGPSGEDNADRGTVGLRGGAHCQCHHGGVAALPAAPEMSPTVKASGPHPVLLVDRRPSRKPAGPERPPRG